MDESSAFMQRALELAHCGRFTVSPNPRVGCVIVKRMGAGWRLIGEGFHREKGGPHAERTALENCVEDPRGASMYINLEPCCHQGSTPPCTDALLEAGIAEVTISLLDPFPQVSGRGCEVLRAHHVEVQVGLLEEEALYENRFFIHRHRTGWPWVILKAAASLDGKLATREGDSKWITSEASRRHVHETRAEVDAVVVGAGTAARDDPLLTVRWEDEEAPDFHPPLRVVLDAQASLALDSQLVKTARETPVLLVVSPEAPAERIQSLERQGVQVESVSSVEGRLELEEVLEALVRREVLSVLVEGGPRLHTAFLEAGLVNEVMIFISPVLIGGEAAPTFWMGRGKESMSSALKLQHVKRHIFGEDTLIQGILKSSLR